MPTVVTIIVDDAGCHLVAARPLEDPTGEVAPPCEACRERLDGVVGSLTTAESQPRTWTLLTRRERQVAQLAAAARPNRSIAEQLGISMRTVENHLSRAYAKLGIATRVELQLLVAALGGDVSAHLRDGPGPDTARTEWRTQDARRVTADTAVMPGASARSES